MNVDNPIPKDYSGFVSTHPVEWPSPWWGHMEVVMICSNTLKTTETRNQLMSKWHINPLKWQIGKQVITQNNPQPTRVYILWKKVATPMIYFMASTQFHSSFISIFQCGFQEPKLEVPTICKAYTRTMLLVCFLKALAKRSPPSFKLNSAQPTKFAASGARRWEPEANWDELALLLYTCTELWPTRYGYGWT